MKLILITLVALVVGMMVGCSSEPASPTNTPPPAFSDDEVIGAVKGHLRSAGMDDFCKSTLIYIPPERWRVHQDKSNPDKYLATISELPNFSWTFIGSLAKVISTSKVIAGTLGC